jgi:hypothetical protein
MFVQSKLGDATGTYTQVDPATAGVTIELIDATHTVPIVIPPRDPRWVLVNPRRGRYRWRGGPGSPVRKLEFRTRKKAPNEWTILLTGKNVPGASTIDYQTLVVRVRIGSRCAERRFHVENVPVCRADTARATADASSCPPYRARERRQPRRPACAGTPRREQRRPHVHLERRVVRSPGDQAITALASLASSG